jgi:hypothetical protein
VIIQVETNRINQIAQDQLKVVEVLGYDCLTDVDLSYLDLLPETFSELFPETFKKLNHHRLCNTLDDAYEFLESYDRLLAAGENLEHENNPTPALLSIVTI